MGNNASSSRKSSATHRHSALIRKSYQSQSNHYNLEEEFSDLILHEVKRQKQQQAGAADTSPQAPRPQGLPATAAIAPSDNFTNDLIEDEYNELNQGILENEELLRNILPVDEDTEMESVPWEAAGSLSPNLADNIGSVDFTQASLPAMARQPTTASAEAKRETLVPVRIKWINTNHEQLSKVAIIGSFCNWRDVIKLKRLPTNSLEYYTTVKLPLGVHKLLYVVNNEYRVLEMLPTATDQEGIFFNWFEVLDPQHLFSNPMNKTVSEDAHIVQTAGEHNASQIQRKSNSFLLRESRRKKDVGFEHVEFTDSRTESLIATPDKSVQPSYENSYTLLVETQNSTNTSIDYSSDIPEMLMDYNYFKDKSPDYELPEPPQLPAHLNNVLLNKISSNQQQHHHLNVPQVDAAHPKRPALRRADSSYYASNKEAYHRSIPNHVILNHLMTTSIRNDVLTVACITRYSGKFVTQIMHSPAEAGTGNN